MEKKHWGDWAFQFFYDQKKFVVAGIE